MLQCDRKRDFAKISQGHHPSAWGGAITALLVGIAATPSQSLWTDEAQSALAITACLPALFALAVYYLQTLSLDAWASSVGSTNLKSIAFGAYELMGASCLNPGRGELRLSPVRFII